MLIDEVILMMESELRKNSIKIERNYIEAIRAKTKKMI